MEKVWYRVEGREVGPFEKNQLLRLIPKPPPGDAIREVNSEQWQSAAEVAQSLRISPAREKDSAAWDIAVTAATELIKEAGWTLLEIAPTGLTLASGTQLLVLLPHPTVTRNQVEQDLELWFRRLKAKEWKGATLLHLVYCLPEILPAELRSLRKKRKAAFIGVGQVYADFADPSFADPSTAPKTLAALDRQTSSAVARGARLAEAKSPASARQMLDALALGQRAHLQLERRLAEVKPWGTYLTLAVCLAIFFWGTVTGGTENSLNLLRFGANFHPLTWLRARFSLCWYDLVPLRPRTGSPETGSC